jgi:hypothetical protein
VYVSAIMADPIESVVLAKDLWPGMVIGLPDPEGIKSSIRVQVLDVEIIERRNRPSEKHMKICSKTEVKVLCKDDDSGIHKRTFIPTEALERLFGPTLA